jgi:carnitine-CoA ligase
MPADQHAKHQCTSGNLQRQVETHAGVGTARHQCRSQWRANNLAQAVEGGGIRRNGDFVNTAFVEKVIAESGLVDDVYVYGVKGASGAPGEKDVVAAVVPADAASFDPQKLFAICRAQLEANFVPSYIQVLAQIPKTASEKPQDRFLIESFVNNPGQVVLERQ